ncbi:hypothetical protein EON65_03770 [archaeon]|nr:MAG: hypothetical protein EON65_03770 [archaeon]
MKDLWNSFGQDLYDQLIANLDGDVSSKKQLLSKIIKEENVDYSHQKELIIDQLFNTMIFIIEMSFDYDYAEQVFKLVVDEFSALMEEQYDYQAEDRLRRWLAQHVQMNTVAKKSQHFMKITKYISTSLFGELEAYHYAFTHLPKMEVKHVPLYVDTPICVFPSLT